MIDTKLEQILLSSTNMKEAASRSGFTLVELIVAVSILMVSLAVVVPTFTGYQRTQDVREAREIIKSALAQAKARALAGVLSTCPASRPNLMGWYLVVQEDSSILYLRHRCYAQSDVTFSNPQIFTDYHLNEQVLLPADVTIKLITENPSTNKKQAEVYYLSAGKGMYFRATTSINDSGWVQCCASGVTLTVGKGSEQLSLKILPSGEVSDAL